MRFRSLLAVLPLLALTTPATAQDCANFEALDQSTMNECAYKDWEAADVALNEAYNAVVVMVKEWDTGLSEGEASTAETLKEAQLAWITFRDKACEAEGFAMRGGSAEPLLVYGCMTQLTEERTNHLRTMIEGYN